MGKDYTVTVSFGGFIGCEQTYEVWATSEEEAKSEALELALDDLEVISVDADEDSENELDLARDDAWDEVMA